MILRVLLFLLLSVSTLFAVEHESEGKLGRFEEELGKTEKQSSSGDSSSTTEEDSTNSNCISSCLGVFEVGEVLAKIVSAPFGLPYNLLQDNLTNTWGFQKYPFASKVGFAEEMGTKQQVLRIGGLGQLLFDGVYGGHLFLEGSVTPRWKLIFNYIQLFEPGYDPMMLLLPDMKIAFTFAMDELFQFSFGCGPAGILGNEQRVGAKFSYEVDIFSDSLHHAMGIAVTFSSGKPVFHLNYQLGVFIRNSEIILGYDFLRTGNENLHGPLLGYAVWF